MDNFTPKYTDILSLYNDAVASYGPRPLFGTKKKGQWEWLTYSQFGALVDGFRSALADLGVGPGDRVAVISNNRVEWAAGCYATLGRGAAYVPMYEAQLDKEWAFILNDCGAKVCLAATDNIYDRVSAMRSQLPALEHVISFEGNGNDSNSFSSLTKKGATKPVPAVAADPKSIAGYIYTSGTTGNPKGVLLSHSNIACNISSLQELVPINQDDRSLTFLPWAHSFGQTVELHGMLSLGASMGICEGVDKIIDNLAEVQPTVLFAVPRIFNRIYDGVQKNVASKPALIQSIFRNGMTAQSKLKNGEALTLGEKVSLPLAKKLVFSKIVQRFGGRLKFAVSGAAALSRDVAEFVDNLGIMVFEGYGLTETSPIATANSPSARRIGSVGKPIPGVRVVLDHEVTGDAVEGEIVIYGHNVMQGYHNLPEETAAVFTKDGGFRSGDMGRIDSDGFVFITGRIKEQYKLENGKYVSPALLEERITLSPFILQTMLYGANKLYNVALVIPDMLTLKEWATAQGIDTSNDQALVKNEKVVAHLKAEVDKYSSEFKSFERVKKILVSTEEFTTTNDMLTPSLKLKRRNVLKRYQADLDALYSSGEVRATGT